MFIFINNIPYIGNFPHLEILANMTLGRCAKFHRVLFSLFQALSVNTRVYFSLSLFLAISGRSRARRKLIPDIRYMYVTNVLIAIR